MADQLRANTFPPPRMLLSPPVATRLSTERAGGPPAPRPPPAGRNYTAPRAESFRTVERKQRTPATTALSRDAKLAPSNVGGVIPFIRATSFLLFIALAELTTEAPGARELPAFGSTFGCLFDSAELTTEAPAALLNHAFRSTFSSLYASAELTTEVPGARELPAFG